MYGAEWLEETSHINLGQCLLDVLASNQRTGLGLEFLRVSDIVLHDLVDHSPPEVRHVCLGEADSGSPAEIF